MPPPGTARHGRPLDLYRPLGIDHDPRLAGRKEAVPIGLDQPTPLLARALGQLEAHIRHVDDEPIGIGQCEMLIGGGRRQYEREACARLVAADLGCGCCDDGAVPDLGRPARRSGLRGRCRAVVLIALLDFALLGRPVDRHRFLDFGLGASRNRRQQADYGRPKPAISPHTPSRPCASPALAATPERSPPLQP